MAKYILYVGILNFKRKYPQSTYENIEFLEAYTNTEKEKFQKEICDEGDKVIAYTTTGETYVTILEGDK